MFRKLTVNMCFNIKIFIIIINAGNYYLCGHLSNKYKMAVEYFGLFNYHSLNKGGTIIKINVVIVTVSIVNNYVFTDNFNLV